MKTVTPILWPPDLKNWLIGKDPDSGKDWRQEEKGTTEDGMVEWHHWLNGHEFEQGLGVGDGQGSLECCSAWGHKESGMTEQLNWMYFILTAVLWSRYCYYPLSHMRKLKHREVSNPRKNTQLTQDKFGNDTEEVCLQSINKSENECLL